MSDKLKDCDGLMMHWCPGCEDRHYINVDPEAGRPLWTWNGNADTPTFSPSVRIGYNGPDAGQVDEGGHRAPPECCHYFIRDGRIEFCGDSTHALAGQTVQLPAIPEARAALQPSPAEGE